MTELNIDEIPETLTETEFWAMFGRLENERLDFKRQVRDLTDEFAAMAMTDGGLVLVGITDRPRAIVGVAADQQEIDRVDQQAVACGLGVRHRLIEVAGKNVLVIAVPEIRGRIITAPDGRLLRRTGASSQALVGDALARFVRDRQEVSAEEDHLPQLTPDDLDLGLVQQAIAFHTRRRRRRALGTEDAMRALTDLGLASQLGSPLGTVPSKAAAILFAKDPTRFVPGASVQAVRRVGVGPGPGPTRVRREIKGPLPLVLANTIEFIDRYTEQHETTIGTHRERLPAYPREVLREAMLNALAHRDYGLPGTTVDVTVWDDRIEIRSPGPLPGHVTIDNIREEHYSRNRRCMTVLKTLRLVEEYGEGVDLMFREMEARLMDPPIFVATASSVTVTLYSRSLLRVEDQAWLALLKQLEMTPQERQVLVLARRLGAVTPRLLRRALPDANHEALLSGAVAKGLLSRVGQAGGTQYVLSPEVVVRAGASGVEARSRKRQMLLDEIRRQGALSTAEAAQVLGEADLKFVRSLLEDLVARRVVEPVGRTRGRRYVPK